jgi:hypothetical protein
MADLRIDKIDFLLQLHGNDIGKSYCLPRNVRVIMECSPGSDIYLEKTPEYMMNMINNMNATNDNSDSLIINMLKTLHNPYKGNKKIKQTFTNKINNYCIFSGNTDKNIIPDIILSNDKKYIFKNGLFELPLKPTLKKLDKTEMIFNKIIDPIDKELFEITLCDLEIDIMDAKNEFKKEYKIKISHLKEIELYIRQLIDPKPKSFIYNKKQLLKDGIDQYKKQKIEIKEHKLQLNNYIYNYK